MENIETYNENEPTLRDLMSSKVPSVHFEYKMACCDTCSLAVIDSMVQNGEIPEDKSVVVYTTDQSELNGHAYLSAYGIRPERTNEEDSSVLLGVVDTAKNLGFGVEWNGTMAQKIKVKSPALIERDDEQEFETSQKPKRKLK